MLTRSPKRTTRRAIVNTITMMAVAAAAIVGFTATAQAGTAVEFGPGATAQTGRGGSVAAVYYQFVARHSGKCMHVSGASLANGADVVQSTCLGVGHQQWRLQSIGDGYFLIIAAHSAKCLDVSGQSDADGANVHQWACHSQFNQHWQRITLGTGYSRFVARHSGKCLEVDNSSLANNTDVQQSTCSGSAHRQQWQLV